MKAPVIDAVIHAPGRLQICAILADVDLAEFATVRDAIGVSDSVMSKHVKQLEDAGYLAISKAARGKAYAREACASCHEVEPGIPTPPFAKAPSFSSVAATPGMTSMALNVWFSTSHPNMPNLIIPQKQKEELMAYFAALRAASKQAEPDQ